MTDSTRRRNPQSVRGKYCTTTNVTGNFSLLHILCCVQFLKSPILTHDVVTVLFLDISFNASSPLHTYSNIRNVQQKAICNEQFRTG